MVLAFGNNIDIFTIKQNTDQLNMAEFYTDVDVLQQALFHIFSTIKDRADKNARFKVDINFINETIEGGSFKKIIITHLNSEASKNSNDPEFAKGDIKTIQYNLWGLCNYEILAKFPDGFRKKVVLTDDYNDYKNYVEKNKSIPIDDTSVIRGFTHILKFY